MKQRPQEASRRFGKRRCFSGFTANRALIRRSIGYESPDVGIYAFDIFKLGEVANIPIFCDAAGWMVA